MPTNPEPIALIDMDGTVADLDLKMNEELAKLRSPGEPEGTLLDLWVQSRRSVIKKVPGFWRSLQPITHGLAVVDLLREQGFRLNVLTKGPFNTTTAWTEKVDWCREYLPDATVTITEDKSLVYGRVLFDDWPPYIMSWLEWRPRGLVVMTDWPHNQDFNHPQVFRFIRHPIGSVEWHTQWAVLRNKLAAARG